MPSGASRSLAVRTALRLVLGALLLRLLVPVGTMPGALTDGWFLKLCPDGLPAETLARLLGESHRHHHHHEPEGQGAPAPVRCDLGTALSGDAIEPQEAPAMVSAPPSGEGFIPSALRFHDSASRPPFRSRAPPGSA